MKISEGLHINLLGVIKNPSSIPENLRHLKSIYVTKQGLAYITFQIASDGYCSPPTTELTEKHMDFFLIEVANTYQGAKIAVKKEGKEKKVWVDNDGIQRARVNGSGQVIRVNNRGHVEIYHISSPTQNDKKKMNYLVRFEDDMNFMLRNPQLFKKMVEDDKTGTLKEHEEDIKKLHKSITEQRSENRVYSSQTEAKNKFYEKQRQAQQTPQPSEPQSPKTRPNTVDSLKEIGSLVPRRTDPDEKKELIEKKTDKGIVDLGLPQSISKKLSKKFGSLEKLEKAPDNEITAISGIGNKILKQIREALKK